MDISRLSLGEKLVGVGGIVLLIATFLPWYGWSYSSAFGSASASWNLWNDSNFLAFLVLLACVVAVGVIVLRMLDVFDISEQGVPESLVVLVAAAVAGLITVLKVVSVPGGGSVSFGDLGGGGSGRSWGLWVGVIAAAIFVIGAVMKFQEERA
jgi:hypothetical protein